MRVLVTGATGFIGRSLVPYLVSKQEIDVTVLLREKYLDTSTLPPPLITCRPYYTFIYADLRNFRMTSQAIRESEPDCVIHLAAAGVTDPFLNINTAVRHNVSGTINLLRACFETNNRAQQLIIGRTGTVRYRHDASSMRDIPSNAAILEQIAQSQLHG